MIAGYNDTLPRQVLFLSHWFPRHESDWGGIFVLEQAQALRAAGVDVRVLVGDPMPSIAWRRPRSVASGFCAYAALPTPEWQELRGVPVAFVPFLTPHPALWGALAPKSLITSLMRWRKQLLDNFAPQIVHAHTAFLDGSAGAWLARRLQARFVLTDGTGPFSTLTQTHRQRRITQSAVNAADVLVPVSQYQLQAIRLAISLSPDVKVRIIGHCLDAKRFKPTPAPSGSSGHFLWIGRLEENKQPLMLLEAFAIALKTRSNLRLTLIGDGPLASDIRARIDTPELTRNVVLLPPQDRQEIAEAMRSHAALVISSRVETFGVVAIEAMASGRPVLATRCGGPEEIIAATGGGHVVDNSAAALAEGMIRMASEPFEKAPSLLASVVNLHYGSQAIANALVEAYGAALNNGPRA